ncbi:MAG: hypothetical protein IT350_01495 [Deltaproteobacteria bacterium]|nr:hypothetical protein [Deltaproteobacteria bacterium]
MSRTGLVRAYLVMAMFTLAACVCGCGGGETQDSGRVGGGGDDDADEDDDYTAPPDDDVNDDDVDDDTQDDDTQDDDTQDDDIDDDTGDDDTTATTTTTTIVTTTSTTTTTSLHLETERVAGGSPGRDGLDLAVNWDGLIYAAAIKGRSLIAYKWEEGFGVNAEDIGVIAEAPSIVSLGLGGQTTIVHIAYRNPVEKSLDLIRDVWSTRVHETVDANGEIGSDIAMAGDTNGDLHIAYYEELNGDLRYATNKSGTWSIQNVLSEGNVGRHVDLALDSEGFAHISCYDATNGRLLHLSNETGTWAAQQADLTTWNVGWDTSIAIGRDDAVYIAYYDVSFERLKLTKRAAGSGVWSSQTVVNEPARDPGVIVDGDGHVQLGYRTETALGFATNQSGSWEFDDLEAGTFGPLAVARAPDATPAYLYHDQATGELRAGVYRRKLVTETVAEVGTVARPMITDLDDNGMAQIVYLDSTGPEDFFINFAQRVGEDSWGVATVVDEASGHVSPDWIHNTDGRRHVVLGMHERHTLSCLGDSEYVADVAIGSENDPTWDVEILLADHEHYFESRPVVIANGDIFHVAYVEYDCVNNTSRLMYRLRDNGVDTDEEVATLVGPITRYDMAVHNGTPMIVYEDDNKPRYAYRTGIGWLKALMHDYSGMFMADRPSIAVDSDGAFHAIYYIYSDVRFIHSVYNEDLDEWQPEDPDLPYDSITNSYDLFFDRHDHMHVVFSGPTEAFYMTDSEGPWLYQKVGDQGGFGNWADGVVDEAGHFHIGYYGVDEASSPKILSYVTDAGREWTSWIMDDTGSTVRCADVAWDDGDGSAIVYGDSADGGVTYAAKPGAAWQFAQAVSGSAAAFSVALAFESDATPHVAFAVDGDVGHATRDPNWNDETIASPGDVPVAIAVDGNDVPHVAFVDGTALKHWTPADGLETIAGVSAFSPVAIAARGTSLVGIAFRETGTFDAKIAWLVGSDWQIEPIDTSPSDGSTIDLFIGTDNIPRAAYTDADTGLIRYAYKDGASWTSEGVASFLSEPTRAAIVYAPIAELAHLAFYDADDTSFGYAIRANDTWQSYIVDDVGDAGDSVTLAIDDANVIHAAYLAGGAVFYGYLSLE